MRAVAAVHTPERRGALPAVHLDAPRQIVERRLLRHAALRQGAWHGAVASADAADPFAGVRWHQLERHWCGWPCSLGGRTRGVLPVVGVTKRNSSFQAFYAMRRVAAAGGQAGPQRQA